MEKIYIAGPIMGMPEQKRPAFAAAQKYYEKLQYEVVNPHNVADTLVETDLEDGKQSTIEGEIVALDLFMLSECAAMVLLAGWEESTGTQYEISFATTYGIPVYEAYTNKRLYFSTEIVNTITCINSFEKLELKFQQN